MLHSDSGFAALGLPAPLLDAIGKLGFETPSPIQERSIPVLLDGDDLLGQAQTGTGKTAAFGLPLLARIDPEQRCPQLLVIAPTRELALQVADAMETFARQLRGVKVVAVYGGSEYRTQLRALRDGAQVVVGTPGRIMDHMQRGSLNLDRLQALVLDEADEMLRMGFIDDVEWILEHTPDERQLALFSATMPNVIRRVAERHLKSPKWIRIESDTTTNNGIRQRFWPVSGLNKLDAMCRILEGEPHDGVIVFARTKQSTLELAEQLQRRGLRAEALNGDIPQAQREKTVARLREGRFDLLIATDVVARGLDVPRISHVINYDMPADTEAYVHRIGRTGRAGRNGEAILFVSHRERGMLRAIERATGQSLESMDLPSVDALNSKRLAKLQEQLVAGLESKHREEAETVLSALREQLDLDDEKLALGLAALLVAKEPVILKPAPVGKPPRAHKEGPRKDHPRKEGRPANNRRRTAGSDGDANGDMQVYRVEVGHAHGVRPGNLVGAIANEAGLPSRLIGAIRIHQEHSTVALPQDLTAKQLNILKRTRVCQRPLSLEAL
ncbi:ATP-dependent RNA helicase DeaD [Alloalcanivorax xenomutans]|jgi:ATP-dependent RNA helicase DeaD|uniref:DEAD/DEAH box helicase n=1 Tax=Alloalcanivorax xenomutans TaxID=1094342 RepID=UPI0006D5C860|nr:DEAD/DEAH box helicase [Alloalcanivorax xenomutans]PHS60154.1 MAG: ATP-dependent RNA helicase [Alcanivorax sp.]CUR48161.1 Cold-shock DEAD-box protein A [Alloalcanivorax xenomutans]SOC04434.1 ATP-dependent RNA helicase DeaD [Alloalcanivorax xenomutans]